MVVFLGENGDTDYEGLLGGLHKTIILKGACKAPQSQVLANRGYPLEDVIPFDSPNIVQTSEGFESEDIRLALVKLGIMKA